VLRNPAGLGKKSKNNYTSKTMKNLFKPLSVLGLILAVSLMTSGCKNPKPGLTDIPTTSPRIKQAGPTGPNQGANNTAKNNNGGGLGYGDSNGIGNGSNLGGNGIDDLTDDQFAKMSADAQREYFEGRPMDREIFKAYTVYFDFDSSSVRPADAANVQHVAEYLSSHGDCALLIEGHCDERGTDEYNQALGERRAQSVKETIANAGIASHRVRTLSYGESKPAEDGTTAEAYAKNRRGEFVLLLPKTEGSNAEAIDTPADIVE